MLVTTVGTSLWPCTFCALRAWIDDQEVNWLIVECLLSSLSLYWMISVVNWMMASSAWGASVGYWSGWACNRWINPCSTSSPRSLSKSMPKWYTCVFLLSSEGVSLADFILHLSLLELEEIVMDVKPKSKPFQMIYPCLNPFQGNLLQIFILQFSILIEGITTTGYQSWQLWLVRLMLQQEMCTSFA